MQKFHRLVMIYLYEIIKPYLIYLEIAQIIIKCLDAIFILIRQVDLFEINYIIDHYIQISANEFQGITIEIIKIFVSLVVHIEINVIIKRIVFRETLPLH